MCVRDLNLYVKKVKERKIAEHFSNKMPHTFMQAQKQRQTHFSLTFEKFR